MDNIFKRRKIPEEKHYNEKEKKLNEKDKKMNKKAFWNQIGKLGKKKELTKGQKMKIELIEEKQKVKKIKKDDKNNFNYNLGIKKNINFFEKPRNDYFSKKKRCSINF